MTTARSTGTSAVVIGGGVAGTAAALRAADAGATVILLERRQQLGGLATSFDRDGWIIDNGQHVFLRCCTAYRELLGRLGAERLTSIQERLDIPVLLADADTVRPARLRRSRLPLPPPLHLAGSLMTYRGLPLAGRVRAARAARALARLDPASPEVDGQSFGGWLAGRGCDAAEAAALWELLAVATINVSLDEASLGLAATVVATGLLGSHDGGDIGRARVPLADIHDTAARAGLAAAGVTVHLGAAVRSLEPGSSTRWSVATDAARFDADAVVLAVPAPVAAALVPDLPGPAAVAALGCSPIVNLHIRFDRPVMRDPFLAVVGSAVQWVFRRDLPSHDTGKGQYLVVSLSAADADIGVPTAELRTRYLQELSRLLPGVRGADVTHFVVTRERAATPRFSPGSRAARPGQETALPGLGLAGAWTDTGWPATLEGATRSGLAAADAALRAPVFNPDLPDNRGDGTSRRASGALAGQR